MTTFLYPSDLVSICKERWEQIKKLRGPTGKTPSDVADPEEINDKCPPFPSDADLSELLQSIYHLSFLAEEARPITVRVIYVLPKTFRDCTNLNLGREPARLRHPVTFSVGELLRLAPAVKATESAITVAPAAALENVAGTGLMIWGVLHLGAEWWSVLTEAESAALCPPNCLTISSFAPGNLTISTLGEAIARLRNGKLIGLPLPELSEGPIGSFLAPAAQELYQDTANALGVERYSDQSDSDQHPFHLYYRTLARLLHLIREQRHGGTLLVLPEEMGPEDGRLADRLSIKYRIEIDPVWELLIREGVANKHYYRLLFPEGYKMLTADKNASASQLKELIAWETRLEGARKRIADFCGFVAALSAVDGAVVISRKMTVLGFGTEIIATSASLSVVKEALDPTATRTMTMPLQRYGTRHRSAMRMCSSFEHCVALVVSQDGLVKAMKSVGADVVMWNDVTLGRFAI